MISTNLVKNNSFTKPYLLTLDELDQIGQNMNLVGYDPQLNITSNDTNIVLKYGVSSSPKILNWVEPYKISGIDYTLFYTEVNSGLNIGDKVFIINGTYDSNLLIKVDKYKKGRDGYKVLFIDKCKVVLDIEFNGSLPSNETTKNTDDFDDFIKVYYLKDANDFLHVNRQVTTRVSANTVGFKFNKNQNNLVFSSSIFSAILIDNGWGSVNIGLSDAPGFFIKDDTASWINITSDFMIGSYSIAATNSNNKILILNDSFTYNGFEFKENSIYSWEYNSLTDNYEWTINVKHENNNVPILTKSNFREGNFNGTWNGGLYGSNNKRVTWGSTTSFWNHGTLLNTIWEKGIMESKYSQNESYIAEFDPYGLPYQKSTNPDNDGYGYNFVINSEIRNAIINNANVSNSVLLGIGSSSNISIVEDHVRGNLTDEYIRDNFNSTLIKKAYFESCGIKNANIENAVIKNSRVSNSRIYSVKSINTHYKSSLFKNSNYISDNIIKILGYDEFTYGSNSSLTHLVYKFYINKRSYEKFKFKDNFYIKGIKLNNTYDGFKSDENISNILNFFDRKFRLGPCTEYIDKSSITFFEKIPIQFNSFVSTPKENQYKYDFNTGENQTGSVLNELGYSLDIFIELNSLITKDSVSFKNIIDFSNAYIQNSDFESGVFEKSNWNSGNHINYNKSLNLVRLSNENGEYDIDLAQSSTGITSSLILKNIPKISTNDEVELDYLKVDDIVFLNAVDYDSRGTVTGITVSTSGSGYTTLTGVTTSYASPNIGIGKGLYLDIVTTPIGGVLGLSYNNDGNGFSKSGTILYTTNTTGTGTGLTLSITDNDDGGLATFSVYNIGQGYNLGDTIEVQTGGEPGSFLVNSITNGEVISASVSVKGLFYKIGDVINIDTGDGVSQVTITGITGSLTRLSDTYKVSNLTPFRVDEIVATGSTSIISKLLPVGVFSSYGAENRYGYLSKTKFYKSKIVSGLFRRAYLKGSLIKNDSIDISDKDFTNIEKLKNLIITDTIFSKNDNILSNAFYMFSSFVGVKDIWNNAGLNDIWDNGILFRSIWNNMTFNNGLVRESTWLDGTFLNGLFYQSSLKSSKVDYNFNDTLSYYKSGSSILEDFNDRLSWRKGTFSNGEFYKSIWEDGSFNGGKLYYSDFYSGVINGGIIGDKSIPNTDTNVYNGSINYTTVENADFKAVYTDGNSTIQNTINWYDGVFNDGVFSTFDTNTATWYNGTFNGGEFGKGFAVLNSYGKPKWKDGIFNGGKFTSLYGTSSGTYSNPTTLDNVDEYAWENGTFNGGEFGNNDTKNNSSWFNGIFNGGKFKGKVWNNGIFTFGEFSGSGMTAIGGISAIATQSNPNNFVQKFINNNGEYYGLWRNGFVTDTKNRYLDQEIFTDLKRSSDTNKSLGFSLLKNILWISGTFSNPSTTIQNSVWLDGTFENGTFQNSAFNPYAIRVKDGTASFNFSDSCKWVNGLFDSGEFSISNWENGKFIMGTATGMVWKKGIVNYMNAYNVFWEDGLWRNGNWEGSYYNINPDGTVTDPYVKQILDRGMSWSGTSSCHIWSVFYKESLTQFANISKTTADAVVHQVDVLENQPPLPPTQFGVISAGSTPPSTSSPTSTKVLGGLTWGLPIGGSASRSGSDTSVDVVFTGVDQFSNITWIVNGTTIILDNAYSTPLTKLFTISQTTNTIRLRGTNPDNNQFYFTNELVFTQTQPSYVISAGIDQPLTSAIYSPVTGTVTVNYATNQGITLTLTANSGSNTSTTIGAIQVDLLGDPIEGSPFQTPLASSNGAPVTSVSIPLTSIGTYDVYINTYFTGIGGTVRLT